MADYLIFKRAAVLQAAAGDSSPNIVTGTGTATFVKAVADACACAPQPNDANWANNPYFSPFGAQRESTGAFKSSKYPSNGPADTAKRWSPKPTSPLVLVQSRPMAFRLEPRSAEDLGRFFLISTGAIDKPYLLDAALWWNRFEDVEVEGRDPTFQELVEKFRLAVDLTRAEEEGLFAASPIPSAVQSLEFKADRARPEEFLPSQPTVHPSARRPGPPRPSDTGELAKVIDFVASRGFCFHPWQIATFIAAVRTKPFVILAGISGTGKTKLPRLIAEATASRFVNIPVKPDWTDSGELLGYERLDGKFVPGKLLVVAKQAIEDPERQYFVLLDEMNIARVEYYLAEVLSHIEERTRDSAGVIKSPPISSVDDPEWKAVCLPQNLCLVGSVNMDESTHGFSKKVLDRSFVIEFSDVELTAGLSARATSPPTTPWGVGQWKQPYLTLTESPDVESEDVRSIVSFLSEINECLALAQLQIGYRVRDEIVLFCLLAQSWSESFTTMAADVVAPLDLALSMKVLPRIHGSGPHLVKALEQLESRISSSRVGQFPHSLAKLRSMLERLRSSGFTSYWLLSRWNPRC